MIKTAVTTFGIFALLCLTGCYNTDKVKNGGLVCGANDACPDGFTCVKDSVDGTRGHCWRTGTGPDAGGGSQDTRPSGPDLASPAACTTAGAVAPFGPFATCSPNQPIAGSSCDPVCQSGCACDRRCVINTSTYGSFLCEGTAQIPSSFVPTQGDCGGSRSASCAPGSVCISDDVCPWTCFKTCRNDIDCPSNSRCSVITMLDINSLPVRGVSLCTPPVEACNPTGGAACASPRANFNCVFLAGLTGVGNTDATVCDCRTLHDKRLGATCTPVPDDCEPGAVCVDGTCREVCDRRASIGSACSSGGACSPIFGSLQYGYCR